MATTEDDFNDTIRRMPCNTYHQGSVTIPQTTMLALLGSSVSGSNPFTTTVVPLTGKNWSVMENSPHLWIVNVCRQS